MYEMTLLKGLTGLTRAIIKYFDRADQRVHRSNTCGDLSGLMVKKKNRRAMRALR
jgi:hypothetical protein